MITRAHGGQLEAKKSKLMLRINIVILHYAWLLQMDMLSKIHITAANTSMSVWVKMATRDAWEE